MVKLISGIAILFLTLLHIQCIHTGNISRDISIDEDFKFPDLLRTDGYYYRIDSRSHHIEVLIFQESGRLLHGYFRSEQELKTYFSQKEIILDSKYASGSFNYQNGVLTINYYFPVVGNEIAYRWAVHTEEGKIIDKDTLVFGKGYEGGNPDYFNDVYKFQKENIPIYKIKNK